MHEEPERDWSLVSLATAAGMSRSIFAERFSEVVGESPMRYLTQLRMNLALTMLTGGEDNISVIAHRLGYASEAAFSRAFRRCMGVPPSSVRRSTERPQP
jgi:AraC-like DNA-binding protein